MTSRKTILVPHDGSAVSDKALGKTRSHCEQLANAHDSEMRRQS